MAHIEGISEYRLANGLQVLLFPDSSRPTVTVSLTVFVGSRHEGYGETGMAHLLEHLLFKGTPTHPNVPQALQKRGARFNGTTSGDRTNYYETLPTSDENLEFAIRLEADRLVNSWVRAEDLASEMTVVRNEFEQSENSPIRVLIQQMAAAAYQWHNYGQPTIGNRSDIERVPVERLRDFYQRYYQPDNAMLVLAGRFSESRARALVDQYFGQLPRPARPLDSTYTEEPPQDGERKVVVRRVGDVGLVGVAYHIPSGADTEYAAVEVLCSVLATEPSGRLYRALVESELASRISGWTRAQHDPGLMYLLAEVGRNVPRDAVHQNLLQTVEEVAEAGVTEAEVERVRQQLLRQRELAVCDSSQVAVELSDWAAQGDWRLFFLYRDRIEQVTADQVSAAAARYCRRNNRTSGFFIPSARPERIPIRPRPNVAAMVADYQGREAVASGEDFEPTPENIERRTHRLVLPSGLHVALLPKKNRGQGVTVRLELRYGQAENLQGFEAAAELLPRLMIRGTQQNTYSQLQEELDRQRAEWDAGGTTGRAVFNLETQHDQLPVVLELLRQVLRQPTLPAREMEILRREQLAELENALSDPRQLGSRRLRRLLQPYPPPDVRYVPSIEEQLQRVQQVTRDQLVELYEQFLGGGHGQLAVVGDFPIERIRSQLEAMFDDWTPNQPYTRLARQVFNSGEPQQVTLRTPDRANAVYYAGQPLRLCDSDLEYAPLVLANFVLGGGSLVSRLGTRVRQQEGLSYGVFSAFSAESWDRYAQLTLAAIANPENVPLVKSVIREELERLLEEGVEPNELAQAKTGYLQRRMVQRCNDSQLTLQLLDTLYARRTMQFHADLEQQIRDLTPQNVLDALQAYVHPDKLHAVIAGDFPAASES